MKANYQVLTTALLAITLSFSGCNKDETETAGPDSQSAVLVQVEAMQPGGNYVQYMGAFPEFPTTQPDVSKLVELGTAQSTATYGGFVFSIDNNGRTISKWEVTTDLKLNKLSTLSYANAGLPDWVVNSFFSETRAFLYDLRNGKILEWNPRDMSITRTLNVTPLPKAHAFAGNPRAFGGKIFLNVHTTDYSNGNKMDPFATVALFDPVAGTVVYKTDNRLATTYWNVMDSKGMVYLASTRDDHYALLYGPNSAVTNVGRMVRFNMTTGEFDPGFEIDLKTVAGGYPSHVYYLNDNELVVETTREPLPASTSADNYFAKARATLKKLNLITRQVTDIPGAQENVQAYWNVPDYTIDGTLYFPANDFPNGDYNSFITKVYRVNGSGATLLYTTTNAGLATVAKIR